MMELRQRPGSLSFTYESVPRPCAGIDEVLVRVHASGISFDNDDRAALPVGVSFQPLGIRSAEFAGTVAGFGGGDGHGRFVVGEEVFGRGDPAHGGAAAEYVVVPATSLAARPKSVSFAESAALPMASVMAWEAIASLGEFRPGQTILVADATTDWALYAVQIASLLGANVVAVAPESSAALLGCLGAAGVVPPGEPRPECDLVLDDVNAVLPRATEPQLTVIAGLVDLGGLRPIVNHTIPIEAAASLLTSAHVTDEPGRAVLLVS
jgi:NADPH:quinone reductase-like Zn-dependent oxidoreductase